MAMAVMVSNKILSIICPKNVGSTESCIGLGRFAQDFTYYSILLFPQNEPIMLLKLPYYAQYFTSRSQFHNALQVQCTTVRS